MRAVGTNILMVICVFAFLFLYVIIRDFVRVAKRIRILPAKGNSRNGAASTRGA